MVHGNNEMRDQKTRVPALVLPVIFTSCVVWGIHVTTQNLPSFSVDDGLHLCLPIQQVDRRTTELMKKKK